jgi:hypothetical protein
MAANRRLPGEAGPASTTPVTAHRFLGPPVFLFFMIFGAGVTGLV